MRTTAPTDGTTATFGAPLPVVLGICLLGGGLAAVPAAGISALEGGPPGTPEPSTNDTENVTLYDAGDTRFDGPESLRTAIESGTLEPADRLVVNETLVAVVESRRLADAMERHSGSTTERFLGALDGKTDVRVIERTPSPQVTRMYATVGAANVTAYRDGTTTYVLLDTGALTFRRDANETRAYTVESFYRERVSVVVGFGLPAPGEWPRNRKPPGPSVELYSERYVTATGTPTESPTPTVTATPTATRTRTRTAPEPTTTAETPQPAPTDTSGPESRRPTTTRGTGPGFTGSVTLAAVLAVALAGRRLR